MTHPAIQTEELTKCYNGTTVVDRLNLQIREGEIFGFLGPNGAGKTTSILMLLGLTEPTGGTVQVQGFDSVHEPLMVKRITGYLPENVGFYEDLTADENLYFTARLNRIPKKAALEKIDRALAEVGLAGVADKEVGKFSKGMKQRLGIASILIKEPRLVILDEPTTGLDPAGTTHILELIVSMARDRGITVMLSSHLLDQVQKICDRVGIIAEGRLLAQGSVAELSQRLIGQQDHVVELEVSDVCAGLAEMIGAIAGVTEVTSNGNRLTVRSDADVRHEVVAAIYECGSLPLQIRSRDLALEEIYLRHFKDGVR